jgi:hypothetical protein
MDDDDTKFAWQLAGGVGYDLTSNLTLEGMVRYQSIMDVGLTSTAAGGSVSSSTDFNSTLRPGWSAVPVLKLFLRPRSGPTDRPAFSC